MLLADAVLIRLAVSARAGADPGLEAAAAQNLSTAQSRPSLGQTPTKRTPRATENHEVCLTLWSPG